jgi:hypothetical protein
MKLKNRIYIHTNVNPAFSERNIFCTNDKIITFAVS